MPGDPQRRVGGVASAAGLATLSGLHAYWAAGGRWPGHDARSLAETVVGPPGSAFPSPPVTAAVAALLGVASASVALTAADRGGSRLRPLAGAATLTAGSVLVLRGALAIPLELLRGVDSRFARLDVLFYSPLSLALGVGCLGVADSRSGSFARVRDALAG